MSDSFDAEFGTSQNANDVVAAIDHLREKITRAIGTEDPEDIVGVVHGKAGRRLRLFVSERELRVLRFAIDRAKETL